MSLSNDCKLPPVMKRVRRLVVGPYRNFDGEPGNGFTV